MAFFETLLHLFHPRRSNNHRPRVLHPEMLLFLLGMATLVAVAIPQLPRLTPRLGAVLGFSSSIQVNEVVAYTNQKRAQQGLPLLVVNETLNQAAQAKGAHMFAQQYWAHTAPDGTQPWAFFRQVRYNYSVAGENLARDFSTTDEMVQAWMNSPTHKANILNRKYQEIGVAVVNGELNGVETTVVVQLFGTPYTLERQPAVAAAETSQDNSQELVTARSGQDPTTEGLAPTPNNLEATGRADVNLETLQANSLTIQPDAPVVVESAGQPAAIFGSEVLPITQLQTPPLFSPLELRKGLFLAIIFLVLLTLAYDMLVMHHRAPTRLVGKNLAHVAFLAVVAYLVIYFQAGAIQ